MTQTTAASARQRTPANLLKLLDDVASFPKLWTGLLLAVAVLSAVRLDIVGGRISFGLHVGTAALVALSLIWLPTVARLIVLVGGTFKAGGVEATFGGLLREEWTQLLVGARQVVSLDDPAQRRVELQELMDRITRIAAESGLDQKAALPEALLSGLARNYERLRRDMPPSAQRTSEMTRIVNEARVRAAAVSPDYAASIGRPLLASSSEGDRIVGLALIQESGDPVSYELVVRLVPESSTAFEMFHALIALQEMSRRLTRAQRVEAIDVIEHELTDPRGVGVLADPGLPSLIRRTAGILRGDE